MQSIRRFSISVFPNKSEPQNKFRPVTKIEMCNFIGYLDTQKLAGPGYIPAWVLNDGELSILTYLKFAFAINERKNTNTFQCFENRPCYTCLYERRPIRTRKLSTHICHSNKSKNFRTITT